MVSNKQASSLSFHFKSVPPSLPPSLPPFLTSVTTASTGVSTGTKVVKSMSRCMFG